MKVKLFRGSFVIGAKFGNKTRSLPQPRQISVERERDYLTQLATIQTGKKCSLPSITAASAQKMRFQSDEPR
jgi:hypothetical protein